MATSACALLLLVIAFISIANFCTCFPFTTSIQPENIKIHKHRALLSHDDHPLTSVLSMQSFTSGINICSLENRACSSELNGFNPFAAVYEFYEGIDDNSLVTVNVDSYAFFRQSILKPGNKILLSKSQSEFPEPALLPLETSILRYDEKEIQQLLSHESVATPTTKEAIQSALLNYCNSTAKGSEVCLGSEFKSCPKSVEEMVEFSKTVLGGNHLFALTTTSTKVSASGSKELLIGDVKRMNVDKVVACHGLLLDTATYSCHSIPSTQVYVVDVIDHATKTPVNTALALCHMDTSTWVKEHVAFKILKSSPGKTEACHWNTDLDIVWVGNNDN